ncbi:TRAP transporter small permease [Desulfoluna spongiiphila]|uniref:TRAP-type C4-dicarboxylate transport system, small permease component n=1 Tax=Desulfoluna spongiiphila TaxID=419481 RepID=A0A1G5IZ51_9BACT|nr:TRAP transporter small permease [Desulfoluna spongiiphila]SCY81297.1 TRAP-type C4-dicarboxylate transport system, small permease component [Desulfoluna spongiiphila]VVS91811.1 trap transporter small membrane protein dctq [Desulfoluna spongiiphila]
MSTLKHIVRNFEEVFGALLLGSMFVLGLANVVTRYFCEFSLAFTEELEVAGLVWLTMLGTSAAFKKSHHLNLQYYEKKLSPRAATMVRMGGLVLAIVLFATLAGLSWFHIYDLIDLEITTEALELPEWIYALAIPAGSVLVIVRIVQVLIAEKAKLKGV